MKSKKIYKRLKWIFIILFLSAVALYTFVEIANRNSKNMTARQNFLKAVYPVFMWFTGKKENAAKQLSNDKTIPPVSFYTLKETANDGTVFDFEKLKGKKIMLVNTASDCGYTGQYDDLQKLSEQYKDKLVILGFPANDFKEQEKGDDKEIAEFCKLNFGVTFPLMQKSSVVKGSSQNNVFKWLTDSARNGWNNKQPSWNFCKYIVDEEGKLRNYFGPAVEPLGKEVTDAINR